MAKSSIVDIYGNPIERSSLDTVQTEENAQLAHLQSHYGDHPSSGLTPAKTAVILREAEQGHLISQCALAEDIEEKDAHVQSELGKRRLAMQGPDWSIVPAPNPSAEEKRDAEQVEEILRAATWLDEAIFDCGDAILKGFANLELQWEFHDNMHYVGQASWRDPGWFQTHPDKRDELRLRDNSYEGAALQSFGWISHRAKAKSGYLGRNGLVRVLVWPFLFKNYSVRDLAEFLEIYGLPLRLGKYPEGASDKEKSTLLRAVMSIGHNAGGVIPKGMDIEFQKAADGGSDPFMAMINWCEKSQSKAILGGTLTSQADGKSSTNALGNVHNEVRQEIRDADLKSLAATLTRDLVYPLYALNGKSYRSPRRMPRLEFDLTVAEDFKTFVEPLQTLTALGVPIPVQWVQDKTKIPLPKEGEPILQIASNQAAPSTSLAALKQADTVDPAERELAALSENITQQTAQANDEFLAQLKSIVDNAESFEQMQEQLLALPLDDQALAEVMSQGLSVAAIAGRYDLLQDAQ